MATQQTTPPPPTEEQADIIQTTRNERGSSLMISAYAGTGKTTTLAMLGREVKGPALALAFNRSIKLELERRLPINFKTLTLNGLGHGAWVRSHPGVNFELDDRKIGKLITSTAKEWGLELRDDDWANVKDLVSRAMGKGIGPGPGELCSGDLETWVDIAANELFLPEDECERIAELGREVLRRDVELARTGTLCFDDQWYCPVVLGGRWTGYPTLLVDETQDLSPMQYQMMLLSSTPSSRWIACGDPKQAIYAWRGADARAMDSLRAHRASWLDRRLTLTFRCPKRVVARQQEHAPGYRAAPEAPDGTVARRQDWMRELKQEIETDPIWGWNFADLAKLAPPGGTMAILCRNNSPLLSLAFKLIRGGIGCKMAGREIGKGLASAAKKIAGSAGARMPIDLFAGKLGEWKEREIALALANGHEAKVEGVRDRAECLFATIEGSQARDVGDLCKALEILFSAEAGLVLLSTIHRAKGLEWDLVMHLDPWRVPSKRSLAAAEAGDRSELEQELNLRYVAETRTKSVLVFGSLEDYNG